MALSTDIDTGIQQQIDDFVEAAPIAPERIADPKTTPRMTEDNKW